MKKNYIIILTILLCFITLFLFNKIEDYISNTFDKIIIVLLFLILSIFRINNNTNIYKIIKKDFQSNEFIIFLIIIISLMINSYLQKNIFKKNINNASYSKKFYSYKQAFIAFILAYTGRLDIVFIPFFLVFIFNYFYD